jgi:hypothetical protein
MQKAIAKDALLNNAFISKSGIAANKVFAQVGRWPR